MDWRAALRRWARGAKKRTPEAEKSGEPLKPKVASSFDTDDFFRAAFERKLGS